MVEGRWVTVGGGDLKEQGNYLDCSHGFKCYPLVHLKHVFTV